MPSLNAYPSFLRPLFGPSGDSGTVRGRPKSQYVAAGFKYGTVSGMVVTEHFVATDSIYVDGNWFTSRLIGWPSVNDESRDPWGIVSTSRTSLTIDNTDGLAAKPIANTNGKVYLILRTSYDDGLEFEELVVRGMAIQSVDTVPGAYEVSLDSMASPGMGKLYPELKFTVENFPELHPNHVGTPVPVPVGTAVKLPCAYIANGAGAGPWKFSPCVKLDGSIVSVLAAYRNGRLISSSEYTVTTTTVGGNTYVALEFAQEQYDFQGNLYTIEADVSSTTSRNAVDEIARLLTWAGVTAHTASFAAAREIAETNRSFIDYAYARDGRQTRIDALIGKLLTIARAKLYRSYDNSYAIIVDAPTDNVTVSVNQMYGDEVELQRITEPAQPYSVKVVFSPSPQDPDKLSYETATRSIGGFDDPAVYEFDMVRDAETADRLCHYLWQRARVTQYAEAIIYGRWLGLHDRVDIEHPLMYEGSKSWKVYDVERTQDFSKVKMLAYSEDLYRYTPQPFPSGAVATYAVDYSKTPPAAPGVPVLVTNGSRVDSDGRVTAYLTVKAIPPSSNWSEIWFAAVNDVTGEMYIGQGASVAGGYYQATIGGLRPANNHTVYCWAKNQWNLDGAASYYASNPVVSATNSEVPAQVTGTAVAQGTGKQTKVTWTHLSISDLKEYVVERKIGAGAFAEVARTRNNYYIDTAVDYGTQYTYQVKAVDNVDNVGTASASVNVTPAANVGTVDITAQAVSRTGSNTATNVNIKSATHVAVVSVNVANAAGGIILLAGSFRFRFTVGGTGTIQPSLAFKLVRNLGVAGETVLAEWPQGFYINTTTVNLNNTVPLFWFDDVAAGSYTYTITASGTDVGSTGTFYADYAKLVVTELKR